MLRLSGKIAALQKQKLVPSVSRNVYFGRKFTAGTSYKCSNHGNDGYKGKEIYLLGPPDARAPLPGNMGIPPITMFATNTLQPPTPVGDKFELITGPSPEERYEHVCSQVTCAGRAELLFGSNKIEYTGYTCPELIKQDFLELFPRRNIGSSNLTVITICRKTENDMSVWSEEGENERLKHENLFLMAADLIVDHLESFHHWAEFIHPSSGTASSNLTNGTTDLASTLTSATMYQTDVRYAHFGFTVEDMGCCRIISHHKWGTHIYVGSIFTSASLGSAEVQLLINKNKLKDWRFLT